MRYLLGLITALLLLTSPARAAWTEVSSNHFVIYGIQSEKELRKLAERLELLHSAMTLRHGVKLEKPSASNRVTIYSVGSESRVRALADAKGTYVAGIYIPRAGATMAIVPRLEAARRTRDLSGEAILYHEYAHHFLHQIAKRSLPRWFVEGFAEFYSAAQFDEKYVGVGLPANHRAAELAYADRLPIRVLLGGDAGYHLPKGDANAFYGQSWLLFHYLSFAPERFEQLNRYINELAAGRSMLSAAEAAFGDLDVLAKDLAAYESQRRMSYQRFPRSMGDAGTITARTLSAGHAAMMPVIIQSQRGVDDKQAAKLVEEARMIAAQYPNDAAVMAALSEAELDAGYLEAALAAADKAITLQSTSVVGHIRKGLALYEQAAKAKGGAGDWKAVRSQFVKANRLEYDHPIPLIRYYMTYQEEGVDPPEVAKHGLERAMQLAPFDMGLRSMVANQMILDKKVDLAIIVLEPIAYDPHGGEGAEAARALIADLRAQLADGKAKPGKN